MKWSLIAKIVVGVLIIGLLVYGLKHHFDQRVIPLEDGIKVCDFVVNGSYEDFDSMRENLHYGDVVDCDLKLTSGQEKKGVKGYVVKGDVDDFQYENNLVKIYLSENGGSTDVSE